MYLSCLNSNVNDYDDIEYYNGEEIMNQQDAEMEDFEDY